MKITRAVIVRPTYRTATTQLALRAASNPSLNIRSALHASGFSPGDHVVILLASDFDALIASDMLTAEQLTKAVARTAETEGDE